VIGGWRKPNNKELHNLSCSSDIAGVSKSRRMRWARYEGYPESKDTKAIKFFKNIY
jgi:hypothetical protein